MFHDLQSLSAWPFSQRNGDFPWSLVVFLIFAMLLSVRRRRRSSDAWRQRGEEMRDRAERSAAELRAYHEQVLIELRQQNDLMRKLLGERGIDVPTMAMAQAKETTDASTAEATEATEPATEI